MGTVQSQSQQERNWKWAARRGAGVGVRMTLLYAALFILYAIVRSTLELLSFPAPDAGTASTILATVVSLIVAALAITLLLIPVSVLAGIVLALLVHLLLPVAGRGFTFIGTLLISLALAFVVADTVQLVLLPAAGFKPLSLPLETWLFWFGLPTLLYVVAAAFEGGRLRSGGRMMGDQIDNRGAQLQ